MKKSACILLVIIAMITIWPAKQCVETASAETGNAANAITLTDALKKGLISQISIEGGEKSIKIRIDKENKEAVNIDIPHGLTTFGFISEGRIRTAGYRGSSNFTKEGRTVEIFCNVGSDDFSGDGFSIEIDKPLLLTIPKDKRTMEVSVDGKLKVSVPSGFSGFILSGISGNIVSGRISIQENVFAKNKDATKYSISFGNMRVTK